MATVEESDRRLDGDAEPPDSSDPAELRGPADPASPAESTSPHVNRGFSYVDRIDDQAAGETVLGFYLDRYRHSDREQWRERIQTSAVTLDGTSVSPDTRLRTGQTLAYARAPWAEPAVPKRFRVLYEDDHVIAVDKPSGLPVLPGGQHLDNTLLALVRDRFAGDPEPSPLHRLGRATSGIVLFARTEEARRVLTEAFARRTITKLYRALLLGVGLPVEQTIDVAIGPVPYPPTGRLFAASPRGKPSTSVCRLLHTDHPRQQSLVEMRILTGRAHQIRIHAAAIGHPLVGDPLYGVGGGPRPLIEGVCPPLPGDCGYHLHATLLAFRHPTTERDLEIVSSPPPRLRVPDEVD